MVSSPRPSSWMYPVTPEEPMTDQDLLRTFAEQANARCLDAFIERHQGSIFRFAARLLGDPKAARDVVEETFLRVAERPRSLLSVGCCRNWLLRAARTAGNGLTRNRLRRRAPAVARVAPRKLEAAASRRSGKAASRHSELGGPRQRALAELARLQPRYREIVYLRLVEGKSYREIADITRTTATDVGRQLHRAMRILSTRLAAGETEELR